MKATGIVRRIDDLGRIVVPKEIRRVLRIKEGDPMEIFTNRDGEIMLKKYSPIGELREFASTYAESLYEITGDLVCITDCDSVVAVAGPKRREYDGKPLSRDLEQLIERRGSIQAEAADTAFIRSTRISTRSTFSTIPMKQGSRPRLSSTGTLMLSTCRVFRSESTRG